MHAIVEKGNKNYKGDKKDKELTLIELYKPEFKVVVNNYRRQKKGNDALPPGWVTVPANQVS